MMTPVKADEDDDLCGTCRKKPVYIGTMCRDCYAKLAYPQQPREPGK